MRKAKGRWWFLAVTVVALATTLVYALWPTPVRPGILYAYSDNAFGMWGLTLYRDGQFDMSLPAAQESGLFRVFADTVEFQYEESAAGLPAAYLINRERKRIDELQRVSGRWEVAHRGNWAELYYDSTRFYTR